MRFKLYEVKFDLTCERHQNTSKTYFMNICSVLMIIKSDLKIDLIISELHYVKFFFLLTSSIDQVFDILTFDK